MQKRPVGKTGMSASIIGLGCEHLDEKPYEQVKETIDAALEGGVNILDVFMPGEEVRRHIGRALGTRRKDVLLQGHFGSTDINQQYDISRDLPTVKRYFEDLLKFLNTDYIDFGMLFFMDSDQMIDDMLNNGIVDYVRDLRKAGVVRAIGASAHNPRSATRVVNEGLADMMLFSINPAFDMMPEFHDPLEMLSDNFTAQVVRADAERAAFYRLCESKGIGLTVMKPLGAGKLLSAEHTPFVKPLTPQQCVHYALTRPAVASVLPGCSTAAEMRDVLTYNTMTDAERDYSDAISHFKNDSLGGFKGACVYCSHCLPCPSDIDIATVNKYLDIARLNEEKIPPSVVSHYRALSAHGGDCVECGSCLERCPFAVPVIENMKKAAALFGE